jgi:hypothetical protein
MAADGRRRAGVDRGTGGADGSGPRVRRAVAAATTVRPSSRPLPTRRAVVAGAMAAAAVVGLGLSLVGFSVMRGSTAGRYVEPSTRPDEPGYQAFVISTPTLAVIHTDDDGELAAVAVLSLRPGDDGGAVTLVPPSVLVGTGTADGTDPSGSDDTSGSATTGADGADGSTDATATDGSAGDGDTATADIDTARGSDPTDDGDETDEATDPEAGDAEATDAEVGADDRGEADDADGTGERSTVADAYDEGGADGVALATADVLGVAVDDVIELDAAAWAELVGPVGPVPVTLGSPVGEWPVGAVELGADDVGSFLSDAQSGEGELERLEREATFWRSWLAAVADGGDDAVPGDTDSGIGRFVRGIAREPSAAVLPVVAADTPSTAFAPDVPRIAELISRSVPYPLSPAPGRRVRVRLLNGTSDAELTAAVVPILVQNGAEITIAGNATSFSVSETTYTYLDVDDEAGAQRLADALGVGEVDRDEDAEEADAERAAARDDDGDASTTSGSSGDDVIPQDVDDDIDVTIVLGDDVQDLIRRLENAG